MTSLMLDRGEHPDRAVAALTVVEDLEVAEHGVGKLDAVFQRRRLSSSVCIRPPEHFDEGVVIADPDRSHRGQKPRPVEALGEGPRSEQHPVVGVNDEPRCGSAVLVRHRQALVAHVAIAVESIDQPTTRRNNVSSTAQQ